MRNAFLSQTAKITPAVFPAELRAVTITCRGTRIQRIAFAAQFHTPAHPVAAKLLSLLTRYFAGECVDFSDVPLLNTPGTAFQQLVWRAIRTIPYGEVRTYAQLAATIGHPRAGRAVGNAAAANPTVIVIPCHRVIRSDGTLGDYGGGVTRKRQLLALEGYRLQDELPP